MKTCKQCGQPMASDAAEGLCARCLLSVALREPGAPGRSDKSAASAMADLPDIGDAADVARRLPQYEIVRMLGRGGMGVVYQARQVQLDRVVALKILPPVDAMTPDFVERFRREARSLAKLSHPNIVTVYEFGEAGGLYYFVMEFVDGVNLRDTMRAGKITPAEALAVVPKICDALQFAHEEGVVHRDIKPENILIDKRGRVKIADFGLAKLLRRDATDATLTQSGMTLGTPRYMAPEQLDKPERVDHRADIYSLGVVFYEMLTGEVPMGRFAPPSEKVQVDVKLDEIVLRSLERDVERRYQHASEVRDDVEKVTSKPQVSAVPAPQLLSPPGVAAPSRAAADSAPVATKRPTRHLLSAVLGMLFIFGVWFGFSFQAKSEAVAGGITKIITLGALDPLYTSESGPHGFQTGFNFFSWSFFAVVVAGIAFGALWRIGREDQGKVPRDPAWWRDWWKQVGVWGGLLLIVCTVRTAMNPAKVLQPPGDRTVASRFTTLFSSGTEFREDPSRIPATRTPGRTDYAYAFSVPANHRVFVWLEWWKDGKRTIDQNCNTGYVANPGQRYDAGVQLVFTDGNVAGLTTAGQKRIDWIFYDPSGHSSSGNWRPDFFAGMATTSSWGEKSRWVPKVGETATLLEIAGGKDSILTSPLTDEGLRAGRWQAAMLLKARIEPVPESRSWNAPVTKMNAWNDNEEPAPALLRLGEQFGAVLDPFTDARNLREQIADRIKRQPDARARAEQTLRDKGAPPSPDTKPEDLVKALENSP